MLSMLPLRTWLMYVALPLEGVVNPESIEVMFEESTRVVGAVVNVSWFADLLAQGWRYMVGLGALPSMILGILLFFCPESPRQLLFHNRPEEATRVLRKIYPNSTEEQLENKVRSIELGVTQAKALNEEISFMAALRMLFTIPANLRALIAACGLMAFQQFCGFNTLM